MFEATKARQTESRMLRQVDLPRPTVLRDAQGRIQWNVAGNTPEQNEQIGIGNIQALFLTKFPDFDELFPRDEDGTIAEEEREEARNFIGTNNCK